MCDILRLSTSMILLSKRNSEAHVADTTKLELGISPNQQEVPVPPGNST